MSDNNIYTMEEFQQQYEQIKKMAELQQKAQNQYGGWISPSQPINPAHTPWPSLAPAKIGPGRPAGSKLKDKDTLVQECVDRLSDQVARLCNKYNISEDADIKTEVDLVETANYTTVILTSTVEIPNIKEKGLIAYKEGEKYFTFVVQEKIKTSNKTASVTVGNSPNVSIVP